MYKPKTLRGRILSVAVVALAVIVVWLLLALQGQGEEEQQRISRKERLRLMREDSAALKIAVLPTADCLPLFVAREHHLLDSLGADIRLKSFTAQMDCDTALAGGSVEGAMTDLVRACRLDAEGTPLTFLTATGAHWQVIAARNARITQPKQVYDKMMAMTRHSATDLLASVLVDSARIRDERLFRVQVNDVGVRLRMMLGAEMDVAALPEPQATAVRKAGGHVLLDTRKLGLNLGVLAFRKGVCEDASRKRQIEVLRKAYNQACDSIAKYGAARYAPLLASVANVSLEVASQVPAPCWKPAHITSPRQSDTDRARQWLTGVKEENVKQNNRVK